MELALFYALAAVVVGASLMVVGQRNPLYSVLWLIASFAGLSAIYLQLGATFIAVIQIIVYAGAIMVLFLFVVMLLNIGLEEEQGGAGSPTLAFGGARRAGAALALVLAAELAWALARWYQRGEALTPSGPAGSVRELGRLLFTEYSFAFEVTSILILAAMVGAVVLARGEGDA